MMTAWRLDLLQMSSNVCVLCLKVLGNSCLKEGKLRRYLETNYEKFLNNTLDDFKEKEHEVKRSRIGRPAAWEE